MTEHKSRIWANVKDRPLPKPSINGSPIYVDVKLDDGSQLMNCMTLNQCSIIEFRGNYINESEITWWRYAN